MARTDTQDVTVSEFLERRVREAVSRDVPLEVAEAARRATRRRLGATVLSSASPKDACRADAYFSAVVRRRSVQREQPRRAAARFVVASVIEDLRSTGRDGEAIWWELERGWNDCIPRDVLEEYRLRLCG
jgi:hypothetical protein